MPNSANSARGHSLSMRAAALLVAYAGTTRVGWNAAAEATVTM